MTLRFAVKQDLKVWGIVLFGLLVLLFAPFIGKPVIGLDVLWSESRDARIFWQLRAPRAVLGWLCGASLSLCGMAFQALFRNPLADPTMLGVASGASFGAAFCIFMGWNFAIFGISGLSLSAFVGASICVLAIHLLGGAAHRSRGATLLLAGITLNFFFSSLVMIVQYMGTYQDSFRLLQWTLGGIQVVGWGEAARAVPALLVAASASIGWGPELDLMTCGPEIAVSRGVGIERLRYAFFFAVSLCVAICVSLCGPIAFVGLMAPHICRLLVGGRHRQLAVASLFFGGAFLTLCDVGARTLWAPVEIPVGIVTSFLGAPFFLWLLLRGRKAAL